VTAHPSPREGEFFALCRARRLRPPRHGFLDASLRRLGAYFSAALLREEVARRPGALQRLDPRTRLAALLLFIVSVSLARSLPALAALAGLALSGLAASRIRPREILGAGLGVAAGFSLLMALPATLNLATGGEPIVPLLQFPHARNFGPYAIPAVVGISGEGLRTAATFLLRALTSVTATLCVALSTRWTDLLGALRILRVPVLILQIAGMTLRYLHLLLRQSEEVHLARKSRTVARQPLRADQRWVGSRLAAAWERSLHLMTEVADAMTARGFSGEIRPADTAPLRTRDWIALALITALCVAAHAA
jgi:cobalt ECF transporter T component CbiQ